MEEQFYLIWPWLLLVGLKYVKTRRMLCYLALAGAAASAIEMAVLWQPGVDPTRVYDGTDTRAFGLLIGAALAFVLPSRPPRELVRRIKPIYVELLGFTGLAVIITMVATVGQYSPFLYRGGMVILSVATAAVVATVVYPGTMIGRVLGMRPLRWTGVRSYGIYLWHYPIIVLTTPLLARSSLTRSALQIAATFPVAALSWRFVEDPIRSGRWELPRPVCAQPGGVWRDPTRALVFSSVAVAAVALLTLTVISPSRPSLSSAQVLDNTPLTVPAGVKTVTSSVTTRPRPSQTGAAPLRLPASLRREPGPRGRLSPRPCPRTPRCRGSRSSDVLQVGHRHRRLDLGEPHLRRLPAGSEPPPRRTVPQGWRHHHRHADLRCALDVGALGRDPQRVS